MAAAVTRPCPVCGAQRSRLFLAENIDAQKLSGYSFASRKVPEYMCHRLVRCLECDLVYADSPPDASELAQAYHQAEFDSSREAVDAAASYIAAASAALARIPRKGSALEIGTGTGVFLERLKDAGFEEVVGIEPSAAAVAAAQPHRRHWIREGMFEEAAFSAQSFDAICCFMTLEHVREPRLLAESAQRLLRPGGVFMAVVHDYRSPVNRILGKRSPIIDIEHLQLFSRPSVARMFGSSGFQDVSVKTFRNRYDLAYWTRLAPVPARLKRPIARILGATGAGEFKLGVNVGNLFVVGFKA